MSSDLSLTAAPGLTDLSLGAADEPIAGARLRRAFAGQVSELAVMRQWPKSVMPASAIRDVILSFATDLAANAVKHTASAEGGGFTVELFLHLVFHQGDRERGGAAWIEDLRAEHGRAVAGPRAR